MAKASKYNKLDEPLKGTSSLSNQVSWSEYEHADKFHWLCQVEPDRDNERLVIADQKSQDMRRSCVYVMVIGGRIFKIGTALRGISNRIGSYNTGKTKYRIKGTNSGANYWILQSLINMQEKIVFYALYPPTKPCEILGETIDEPFPSAKSMEGVVIRQFEKRYGTKPIGCTQG